MKFIAGKCTQSWKSMLLTIVASLVLLASIGAPRLPSLRIELPNEIPGELAAGIEPKVCIGYDELKRQWGAEWGYCPAGYAFYGVDDPAGDPGPAEKITATMSCCELPAEDILTEEHVFVTSECPINFVATGGQNRLANGVMTAHLRCTRINTERYQLGEMTAGIYWGDGAAGWQGSQRIHWENIPAAMRYAHGRQATKAFDVDGCVGYPWGSLLTKKENKYCAGFSFRQLQFKGVEGDPSAGTPVRMLPACDRIEGYDNPLEARCQS